MAQEEHMTPICQCSMFLFLPTFGEYFQTDDSLTIITHFIPFLIPTASILLSLSLLLKTGPERFLFNSFLRERLKMSIYWLKLWFHHALVRQLPSIYCSKRFKWLKWKWVILMSLLTNTKRQIITIYFGYLNFWQWRHITKDFRFH